MSHKPRMRDHTAMSWTGLWTIAAINDADVHRLRTRFDAVVNVRRSDPAVVEEWRRWAADPNLEPGYFPDGDSANLFRVAPRSSVTAFMELASGWPLTDPSDPNLVRECRDAWDPSVEPFGFACRKDHPVAALFHGIGPERAALLPGWFGDFILTAKQVRRTQAQVEGALGSEPITRITSVIPIREWLHGMGENTSTDPEIAGLLYGPSRLWQNAVSRGLGLVGTCSVE
jgi:hypothetical protein